MAFIRNENDDKKKKIYFNRIIKAPGKRKVFSLGINSILKVPLFRPLFILTLFLMTKSTGMTHKYGASSILLYRQFSLKLQSMASVGLGNLLETAFNWIGCKTVLAIGFFSLCNWI